MTTIPSRERATRGGSSWSAADAGLSEAARAGKGAATPSQSASQIPSAAARKGMDIRTPMLPKRRPAASGTSRRRIRVAIAKTRTRSPTNIHSTE